MSVEMEVTIKNNRSAVLSAFNQQLQNALTAIGMTAEGHAKDNCPVDTGRLRNSITYATSTKSSDPSGPCESDDATHRSTPNDTEVVIGTNVEYAQAQEFGSYKHKVGKAHYLRDAISDHKQEYKDLLKEALKS